MPTATDVTKTLQIFKPGRQTASNGETLTYTEADLRATVNAYNPKLHEAPIVIGHPAHNLPAYGWVKSLAFSEGGVEAVPDQVNPDFAEMVRNGAFKKISASFYRPDSAANPVPGVWYLRHVGFLGAQPPAVKGLRQPEFAGDDADVVSFGDIGAMSVASAFRGLRDWIISKFGLDEADKVLPTYLVGNLELEAARPEPDPCLPAPAYSEEDKNSMTVTPEQLAAREADLNRREQDLKDQATRVRKAETAQFLEGLVQAGKVLPAHKEMLVAFMADLSDTVTLEFGEGDAKTATTPLTAFKKFLGELPKAVDFGERAPADQQGAATDYSSPPGYQVDQERLALHNKALSYQDANPGVTYESAVKAVGGH